MDHVKDYSGKGPTYGVFVPELRCDDSGVEWIWYPEVAVNIYERTLVIFVIVPTYFAFENSETSSMMNFITETTCTF